MSDDDWLRTGIGASTPDTITIRGHNLADELMGRVTFTELAYLLVSGQQPTDGQARMLDAVLVSLADHGLTPTVLAARLTYTGAPEALQGAVASGLLGAGSVFLGVVEDTALFLQDIADTVGADAAVRARLAAGKRVPGLGHPVHKLEDPRTPRMYAIAERPASSDPTCRRCGGSPPPTPSRPAGRFPSTAPVWPVPPWQTSASHLRSCADSR